MNLETLQALWVGLAVAVGSGLLIGLERERRKGQGPHRGSAGIRTFTLVALAGALAQSARHPELVVAGAAAVIVLAAAAYLKSPPDDPGLTTEIALFVTYLIGVLAIEQPALGAASGAGVAMLLASREQLHQVSIQTLSEQEVRDLTLLAALALVVLPLVPADPIEWLGGLNPRALALLVVLILALQAAGHVATRWLGARWGLAASGFFSGFVSSTATIASMGVRARAQPALTVPHAAAGVLSSAATWLQALVVVAALAPDAVAPLVPAAAAGALAALGVGGFLIWRQRGHGPKAEAVGDSALQLREALIVATVLSIVMVIVSAAQSRFGQAGLFASVALAALADAHAPIASSAGLVSAGRIEPGTLLWTLLAAVSANTASRCVTALVAGGWPYARLVALGLLCGLACAWAAAWASRAWAG